MTAARVELNTFIPLLNSIFQVSGLPFTHALRLTAVDQLPVSVDDPARVGWREVPFSLEFTPTEGNEGYLEQATWTLVHDSAGPFEIFFTPRAPTAKNPQIHYQAVFS